jgi:hypothetical protein
MISRPSPVVLAECLSWIPATVIGPRQVDIQRFEQFTAGVLDLIQFSALNDEQGVFCHFHPALARLSDVGQPAIRDDEQPSLAVGMLVDGLSSLVSPGAMSSWRAGRGT